MSRRVSIGIVGAGAIGTLLAHRFARHGHHVTVVARGDRLRDLRASGGELRVRDGLAVDESRAYVDVVERVHDACVARGGGDYLFVTVRRQQADGLLDELRAARARQVVFVFNAATDLGRYRDAVGKKRFLWLFPAAVAAFEGRVLVGGVVPSVLRLAQITTVGALPDHVPESTTELRQLLAEAGVATSFVDDMQAWLCTHAAFMAPIIAAGVLATREGSLVAPDAALVARAMSEGFRAVVRSGRELVPTNMAWLARVPDTWRARAIGIVFRSASARRAVGGRHARDEAVAMLDDLIALSADHSGDLRLLRGRLVRD